jgi:hypothetical protein
VAAPVKTRGGAGFKVLEPAPLEERLTVAQADVRRAVTLLQDALEAIERGDARTAAMRIETAARLLYAARWALREWE